MMLKMLVVACQVRAPCILLKLQKREDYFPNPCTVAWFVEFWYVCHVYLYGNYIIHSVSHVTILLDGMAAGGHHSRLLNLPGLLVSVSHCVDVNWFIVDYTTAGWRPKWILIFTSIFFRFIGFVFILSKIPISFIPINCVCFKIFHVF